jgi:hypothetical protein
MVVCGEDIYAVLAAEPDNPYDHNAVTVWIQGLNVGYLSREDARRCQPGLLALEQKHAKPMALAGVIAGVECEQMALVGWRLPGPRSSGLRPTPHAGEPPVRVDDAD